MPTWRDSWREWKLVHWPQSICTSLRAWKKAGSFKWVTTRKKLHLSTPTPWSNIYQWYLNMHDMRSTCCFKFQTSSFCSLSTGVHALQFLQRAQNIGKVVISQSWSETCFSEWGLLYKQYKQCSSLQLLYLLHLDCLDCSWYVLALFARPSKMCRVAGTHILSGGTGALGIANASDTFGAISAMPMMAIHLFGVWVLPGHCTIPGWRGSQIHLPSFKGWPSSNRGKEWFWEYLTYHCFLNFRFPV